ncbi:hypothetical protein [Flavobacterium frigidarium]|uniref:hypothetical protein n=1 Tax=Flavobacterium frigidarium TaxID=99286 RepID=UPI000408298B|nr:hypothetical protein [Flavobacterium frigidarium]
MDQNTTTAIFNLMQNVVDKLDALSENLKEKEDSELKAMLTENSNEIKISLKKAISNQTSLAQIIQTSEGKIIESFEKNKTIPSVNNYTEYNLIGSKSHFKPLSLLLFAFALVVVWSSIKYLPSYFNESSLLSKEKENYELFYNYVYLQQFKKSEIITADVFLKKIKDKDTLFLKEYNVLLETYQKERKKQQLKDELKSLESHDR